MPIIALLAAILAALVYAAERLAFAVMLYLMGSWLWRASTGLRAWIAREAVVLSGHFRVVHQAVLHWFTMRQLLKALRS